MNKTFVCLRFGKWSHKATSLFLYERVYRKGYQPTLICLKRFRTINDFIREAEALREPEELETVVIK